MGLGETEAVLGIEFDWLHAGFGISKMSRRELSGQVFCRMSSIYHLCQLSWF